MRQTVRVREIQILVSYETGRFLGQTAHSNLRFLLHGRLMGIVCSHGPKAAYI